MNDSIIFETTFLEGSYSTINEIQANSIESNRVYIKVV